MTPFCFLLFHTECYHTLLASSPASMIKIVTGGENNVWIEFKESAERKGTVAG